jgi:hypothetical protein
MSKWPDWSEQEIQLLETSKDLHITELQLLFPNRSFIAIQKKLRKHGWLNPDIHGKRTPRLRVGDKVNRLTILAFEMRPIGSGKMKQHAFVECDCKNKTRKWILGTEVKNGHTKSCGCLPKEKGRVNETNRKPAPPTGTQFHDWTVVGEAKYEQVRHAMQQLVWCRCVCGTERWVLTASLKVGQAKHCGCRTGHNKGEANRTHGRSRTILYKKWNAMVHRCSNKKLKRYGARGITVCEEWVNSFEAFETWSLANGYRSELSIDRIDNDGNYCPENCRWVDRVTQANNKGSTKLESQYELFALDGESKTVSEWARDPRCKVPQSILRSRLDSGWKLEKALATPKLRQGERKDYKERCR